MHAFDFIMLFFSFIYALALTHLLLAVNAMIHQRRRIKFSWPHAIWMFDALLAVSINWISLWDFHDLQAISLSAIVGGFVLGIAQYLVCALVSPTFKEQRDFDLTLFQKEQSHSYLSAFLVLIAVSIGVNIGGSILGIQKWMSENALVIPMLAAVAFPLFVRNQWVQMAGGTVFAILNIAYLIIYYPVLR
ncbi:MAG TPA: hypothetical protein VKT72_17970 [Candidatus Baltobacteraceae bacterium]|nr:hypothetical protein [Candidatus Baltobacteraceae bacterium]